MAFAPLANPNGTPSGDAMLQQIAMINCVYRNQRVNAQNICNLVGDDTFIIKFQFRDMEWPPSYCVTRSGNQINMFIAGTVNAQQWAGAINGCFAGPFDNFGCYAHSFFLAAWQNVWADLIGNLPNDWRNCTWNFSGHSLGGACAWFGALQIAQEGRVPNAPIMMFAAPKCMTTGFNQPIPDPAFNIIVPGDCVPYLPPSLAIVAVPTSPNVWEWSIPQPWHQYADIWVVNSTGNFFRSDAEYLDGDVPISAVLQAAVNHFPGYYQTSIQFLWLHFPGNNQDLPLYNLALNILAGAEVQIANPNLNQQAAIDLQQQNADFFLQPVNGPLNANNVLLVSTVNGVLVSANIGSPIFSGVIMPPPVPTPVTKYVFSYHDNLGGITDTWFSTAAQVAFGPPPASIVTYITARLGLSGAQMTFDKLRVTNLGASRQTRVFFPNQFPPDMPTTGQFELNQRRGIDQADAPFLAIMLNKLSATTSGRWFFRGSPDELAILGGQIFNTAAFTTALNALQVAIIANQFGWAAVQPAVIPPTNILSCVPQGDGTQIITLANAVIPGPYNNTRMQVRIRRVTSPPWLNGGLTVTPIANNQVQTIRQTPIVGFVVGQGQMTFPNRTLFIQLQALQAESIRERKAGRPFGLFRGRSKARVPV